MKRYLIALLILLVASLHALFAAGAGQAQQPVARAIFFFSPSCPHCETVMNDVIPPLIGKYKSQLEIAGVDVSKQAGQNLFKQAIQKYKISQERQGVPLLVIGSTILVGDQEIPDQLPGLIDKALASGGLDWPDIPGLQEMMKSEPSPATAIAAAEQTSVSSGGPAFIERFNRDVTGNSLATIVLIGMLISVVILAYDFIQGNIPSTKKLPGWLIPLLAIIGIGISLYLTYVEVTHSTAICGPIGNCNTVQQSPYARLFGVLPVGILGAIGYAVLLVLWLVARMGPEKWKRYAIVLMWAGAWFGIMFSIYLTFLEPFVIGSACIWCISSAIVMTLLLWLITPYGMETLGMADDEAGELPSPAG